MTETGDRQYRGSERGTDKEGAAAPPCLRAVPSIVAVLLLILPGAMSAQPAELEGFDGYVRQAMESWEVPGLGLAVVKDDSVVYARGYGVREEGTDEPVDENTVFAVGSTSKAFTSAAVGMLVDGGEVAWSDPVTKHLPWLQLADPWVTRELTVRDLLTHRSGLPRCDQLWYAMEYSRDEVLRRVRHCDSQWSFRSRFGYQNIMYLAAGRVASEAAGVRWDRLVENRIFGPLGMSRSNTSVDSLEGMGNVATPHAEIDGEVRAVPWRDIDNIGPAGSINSSAVDMAQWVRLHLGEGAYEGQRLLGDSTVAEMHRPEMLREANVLTPEELFASTHFTAYGLGWFLRDYRGRKVVWHGGAIDGMRATVGMMPEEELGVVVLTNRGSDGLGGPLMWRVFDAYLGAPEKDWASEYGSVYDSLDAERAKGDEEVREARDEGTSPALALDAYEGTYRSQLYGPVEVSQSADGLELVVADSYGGELGHWHHDTFRITWEQASMQAGSLESKLVTFRLGARGEVSSLEIPGMGSFRAVDTGGDPEEGESGGG